MTGLLGLFSVERSFDLLDDWYVALLYEQGVVPIALVCVTKKLWFV